MLAYLFLFFVLIVFSGFVLAGVKRWTKNVKYPLEKYNGLISHKYVTDKGQYMIVLQIRDTESKYEVSSKLYQELQLPIRGELTVQKQKVIAFHK